MKCETQCAAAHLLRNKSTAWLARASMGRTWDQQRMIDLFNSFISKTFLRSVWALEYENFMGSAGERALAERLVTWAIRKDLRETSAEPAFIRKPTFFRPVAAERVACAPVPASLLLSTIRYSSRIGRPSNRHSRISRAPAPNDGDRGPIDVKGKGQMLTWFLVGRKAALEPALLAGRALGPLRKPFSLLRSERKRRTPTDRRATVSSPRP
jgi:hypothetical protein